MGNYLTFGNTTKFNNSNDKMQNLVNNLKNNKYKNIIIMCGAGISTNAGIFFYFFLYNNKYFNLYSIYYICKSKEFQIFEVHQWVYILN